MEKRSIRRKNPGKATNTGIMFTRKTPCDNIEFTGNLLKLGDRREYMLWHS